MRPRDEERIRRFLSRGEARVEAAAKPGIVLLSGEHGKISAPASVLAKMAATDELVKQDRCVRLSEAGEKRADGLGAARQVVVADEQAIQINLNESPLAMLYRRKGRDGQRFLTRDEFEAGERLRSDYERASIMPRLGANWEASVAGRKRGGQGGSMVDLSDAILAARQRVDHAIAAVGPELGGVLIDICCFLKGLETVEVERRWPARSAKLILKAALGSLARHYNPPRRPRTGLHWGAEDYRPRIGVP